MSLEKWKPLSLAEEPEKVYWAKVFFKCRAPSRSGPFLRYKDLVRTANTLLAREDVISVKLMSEKQK